MATLRSTEGSTVFVWIVTLRPYAWYENDPAPTPIEGVGDLPGGYLLSAPYPNPFNPSTTIRFGLPESALVRLVVYDVLGRQVLVLVDGTRAAGTHEVVFEAGNLPSGTYLVQLVTPAGSFVKTMQLVK